MGLINYNFPHSGGQVDKYEVELLNNFGTTSLQTNVHVPAFSAPVTGSFTIAAGTYKVKLRTYIGTFVESCSTTDVTVSAAGPVFAVFLSRSGNTLTAQISNGTAPYVYVFAVGMSGSLCASNTFDNETGTVSGTNPSVITNIVAAAYSDAVYQYSVQITNANNVVVVSNLVTYTPCLVPETLITLPEGGTMILKDITVGTLLFDKNGVSNKVTAAAASTVDKLFVINGGLLKASKWHIHPIHGGALFQSYELVVGQMLIDKDGEPVEITSIDVEEGEFEVINISTETELYVANGILTHNKILVCNP